MKKASKTSAVVWRPNLDQLRERIKIYLTRLSGYVLKAVLAFIAMLMVNLLMLVGGKILWVAFISTQIGTRYQSDFSSKAMAIEHFLNDNFFTIAIAFTLPALVCCLVAGLLGQVLQLNRNIFFGREGLSRILCCALPIAMFQALFMEQSYPHLDFVFLLALALVPTVGLFGACFELAAAAMPEPETFFKRSELMLRVWDEIRKTFLYYVVIVGLSTGCWMVVQMLWSDFQNPEGIRFLRKFTETGFLILFDSPVGYIFSLFLGITAQLFWVYFTLGVVVQLAHGAWLYLKVNRLVRMIIFGLVPALFVGRQVMEDQAFVLYSSGLLLTLPIAMVAFKQCYALAIEIVPEFGEVPGLLRELIAFWGRQKNATATARNE